jgi:ABC-type Mn2+/Zn2+ transport system permease subunit
MSPFDRTRQGVLTGLLPRTGLYLLWVVEPLAVVSGIGSFLLIRRNDVASETIIGIVARSLCGIAVGFSGDLSFG